MAWVAAVAAGVSSAIQSHQKAKQKEQEARGYQEAGRRRLAAGTREAREQDRKREYMNSRALAVGAASGAGTSGPGFVKVLADLDAEGEYRTLSTLWSAQNDSEGLYFRANAARREMKSINSMAMVNALTSATSAYFGAKGGSPTSTTSTGPTGSVLTKSPMSEVLVNPGGMEIPGFGQTPGYGNA